MLNIAFGILLVPVILLVAGALLRGTIWFLGKAADATEAQQSFRRG
jgi:hypothetical protein